jgi:MFS superfamily sulfate permease-like transporter
VVITAALSLADLPATARLWHQRKVEFSLSIVAFLGVALLGVLPGIAIAVGLSILNVFRRAWRPHQTTLGLVDGLAGYHSVESHPDARLLPGLVLYRFDAPLFFANAKTFRDEVAALARSDPPPEWIVVAAEPITDVDTTAADVLFDLDHLLDEHGQTLVFAELKDPVRRSIERYGLTREIPARQFFPTVEAAVGAWTAKTGARWADPPSDTPAAEGVPEPRAGQPGMVTDRQGGAEQPRGGRPL